MPRAAATRHRGQVSAASRILAFADAHRYEALLSAWLYADAISLLTPAAFVPAGCREPEGTGTGPGTAGELAIGLATDTLRPTAVAKM